MSRRMPPVPQVMVMEKQAQPGPVTKDGFVAMGSKRPTISRRIPYRKVLRWGRIVVGPALGPFLLSTTLGLALTLISQLQLILQAAVMGQLAPTATEKASQGLAQSGGQTGGWLGFLVPEGLWSALLLLIVVTLGSIGCSAAERICKQWADTRMLGSLQRRLHDALLELGPSYHKRHSVGETSTIVARLAGGAQLMFADVMALPLIQGVGLITALFLLQRQLAGLGAIPLALKLCLLGGIIAMPSLSSLIAGLLRNAFTRVRDSELVVSEELQSSLAQPLEVQLMGANVQRSQAFSQKLRIHLRNRFSASARNEIAGQLQSSLPTLLQLAFLVYAVYLAHTAGGKDAAKNVISIYLLVPEAMSRLHQLTQFYSGLNTSWPYMETVIEVLEARPDVVERPNAVDIPDGPAIVELENVGFSYGPDLKPVLQNLSASFVPGRVTAIVGASGSGKSTVLNLVGRLSDPQGGRVVVAGVDVRNARLSSLRHRIVRVAQFPLFIADTVRANFLLAKADATDAEIESVCRETGLWAVLLRASGGKPLDYVLPRDVAQGLSGGQRRLLAVSRALLHRPSVLLVDELTAGLDNLTLQSLVDFIRKKCEGLTVIVIDHDIEGFISRVADQICVLDGGRIAAVGTHTELIHEDGLYRRLAQASMPPREDGASPSF